MHLELSDDEISATALTDRAEALCDLFSLTVDQLRTLTLLWQLRNDVRVAESLGRQQSSIRSQIRTISEYAKSLCGEGLGDFGNRGEPYRFTETGAAMARLAAGVLRALIEGIERQRCTVGTHLKIATTTYMLPHLRDVWSRVQAEVRSCELSVDQIRTRNFWPTLAERHADLILGAAVQRISNPGVFPDSPLQDDLSIIQLSSETLHLLTTQKQAETLASGTGIVDFARLLEFKTPFIMQEAGIILDACAIALGGRFSEFKRLIRWSIQDVQYGLNLIRSGVAADGVMIALRSLALHEAERTDLAVHTVARKDLVPLRAVPLSGEFGSVQVVTGLFGRRSVIEQAGETHPIRVFWNRFNDYAASYRGALK